MPKNIIFYFSGTGNSLKAAKDIAAAVGGWPGSASRKRV